ncbi:Protein CHAPERONE-LIKE PROTEIN OF POR1-like [Dillenia turbinata]|uniref:Protein CHAPERONE-LIKE PROTEIN OF POR1-like n=1 Tax=Dillenia turbinata TaxID=194707 RepID=A0AAN8V511_9MAGN
MVSQTLSAEEAQGIRRRVAWVSEALDAQLIRLKKFRNRKRTKINLKTRLKQKVEESPPWVKSLLEFFEVPPTVIILRRLFLFAFMGGWSIMDTAEGGPAFQLVYTSSMTRQSVARASVIGFGALVAGWICRALVVPMVPSFLLQPTWTLELLTSLVVAASERVDDDNEAKNTGIDDGQTPPLFLDVLQNPTFA